MLNSLLSAFVDVIEDADGNKSYVYDNVYTAFAEKLLVNVFLYTAIVLAVILVGVGMFVWYKRNEKFQSYIKCAISIAIGFAITVIVAMFALEFAKVAEKNYLKYDGIRNLVLIPTAVLAGLAVLGGIGAYICSLISKKVQKIGLIVTASVIGAMIVALMVCIGVYYAKGYAEYNNWPAEVSNTESIMLYISVVGIIAVIVLLTLLCGRGEKLDFDSKTISYASICIALSFALSYIKAVELPQGGSITPASLLPLMVFSYMFGTRKGVIAGFIYGILQTVQDLWLIHPAQVLLDYPVAFAAIGLAGMFSKVKSLDKLPQVKFVLGAVVASLLRYASHVLSGVFAFSEYAPGSSAVAVWTYSLGYNSFVFADIAIAIVVGVILFSSKTFVKQVEKHTNPDKKIASAEDEEEVTSAS